MFGAESKSVLQVITHLFRVLSLTKLNKFMIEAIVFMPSLQFVIFSPQDIICCCLFVFVFLFFFRCNLIGFVLKGYDAQYTTTNLFGDPAFFKWGAPTNMVRVPFSELTSYVGWVCCWFSSLLRGVFSGYAGFPPSLKTNTSQLQFNLELKVLRGQTDYENMKLSF